MSPYIWMPPVHTQHKERMLCQTKGVSIYPHTFGCPHMFECLPVCLDAPMFGWSHMPPCIFGHPIWMSLYVRVPLMFGCPLYAWHPICLDDVWMPAAHTQHKERMLCQTKGVSICPNTFGCPLYIHNTKKACFVRQRGCPCAPLYVWMLPVCLDATIHLDGPCMFGCPHMFGHPRYVCMPTCMFGHPQVGSPPYVWIPPACFVALYVWHPSVWLDASTCLDTPCMFGCPPYT